MKLSFLAFCILINTTFKIDLNRSILITVIEYCIKQNWIENNGLGFKIIISPNINNKIEAVNFQIDKSNVELISSDDDQLYNNYIKVSSLTLNDNNSLFITITSMSGGMATNRTFHLIFFEGKYKVDSVKTNFSSIK